MRITTILLNILVTPILLGNMIIAATIATVTTVHDCSKGPEIKDRKKEKQEFEKILLRNTREALHEVGLL